MTLDELKSYGANVEEGMTRCMGNEALYLKLVATIPGEQKFELLKESIENSDLDMAFENAHALKGVTGNLSLTPLYEPLVKITELLRARENTDYSELLEEIISEKDKLERII